MSSKLIIGHSEGKISDKNRIFLPSFTLYYPSEEIIFTKITFEEQQALKVTAYKRYLDIIERFRNLRNNARSLEEYNRFSLEIEKICFNLQSISEVDAHRRVALPKYSIEEYNWNVGDTLLYDGLGDSVLIRKK